MSRPRLTPSARSLRIVADLAEFEPKRPRHRTGLADVDGLMVVGSLTLRSSASTNQDATLEFTRAALNGQLGRERPRVKPDPRLFHEWTIARWSDVEPHHEQGTVSSTAADEGQSVMCWRRWRIRALLTGADGGGSRAGATPQTLMPVAAAEAQRRLVHVMKEPPHARGTRVRDRCGPSAALSQSGAAGAIYDRATDPANPGVH